LSKPSFGRVWPEKGSAPGRDRLKLAASLSLLKTHGSKSLKAERVMQLT
jgi:hypothetical protein